MSSGPQILSHIDGSRLPDRDCHIAVGMFDGVHRGHRLVIEAAVEAARRGGGTSGVLTFWPHPSRLFRPEEPTRLIFDMKARRELLAQLGVDFIIEQPFTREYAAIEAERFVDGLRGALPRLDTLYVGENWRFGRGRRGDVSMLVGLGRAAGVNVVSIDRLHFNGEPVSSTRIRSVIERGDIDEAGTLLGFSYFSSGQVVPGRRLGRTIGVPTLNFDWQPDLQPAFGVYAVRVGAGDSQSMLPGVANFGVRPTVDGAGSPLLEVHVLGECPFGVGDRLRVDWLRRLRREQRFASVEDLRAQIEQDRRKASAFFGIAP